MKLTERTLSNHALKQLNICFHILHLSVIFFFLFGWLIEETRVAHYLLSLLILFSWFGLGIFLGFGYCVITDMQWKIKKRLNQEPQTKYDIKYMVDKVTGMDTCASFIHKMTAGVYYGILIIATVLLFYV